jgi:hypothetical protein
MSLVEHTADQRNGQLPIVKNKFSSIGEYSNTNILKTIVKQIRKLPPYFFLVISFSVCSFHNLSQLRRLHCVDFMAKNYKRSLQDYEAEMVAAETQRPKK